MKKILTLGCMLTSAITETTSLQEAPAPSGTPQTTTATPPPMDSAALTPTPK